MQIEFQQRINYYAEKDIDLQSFDVLIYLNRAQEDFIRLRLKESEEAKEEYEGFMKKIGANKKLVKVSASLDPVEEAGDVLAIDHLVSFSLPSDYLYYIKSLSN